MWTRRALLKSGGLAALAAGAGSVLPVRAAALAPAPEVLGRRKVLVTIFQRGAMDGLMAVSPLKDRRLRRLRPSLAMSTSRRAAGGGLIDLDGAFGLHPALGRLLPHWRDGRLAIVHAVGSPHPTRSHFDAERSLESGTPGRKRAESGWLGRASILLGEGASPLRAVAVTPTLPLSFFGAPDAVVIRRASDLGIRQPHARAESRRAGYPDSRLGRGLRQIALLIKAQVGLELAFAESRGWDTHVEQGTTEGAFAQCAGDLAASLSTFWSDLGTLRDDVVVVTTTEFGRAVSENDTGGTDHGHASCLFVLGNRVDGGRVHGRFPGLGRDELFEGRDLAVTTDFRAVFSAVARGHLGIRDDRALFPGWSGRPLPLIEAA